MTAPLAQPQLAERAEPVAAIDAARQDAARVQAVRLVQLPVEQQQAPLFLQAAQQQAQQLSARLPFPLLEEQQRDDV